MGKKWINHYVYLLGEWVNGQPESITSSEGVNLGGVNVRLWETSRSGSVLLSPVDGMLASYGDPEVYLTITYTDDTWEYLSAPLTTPVDLVSVASIELSVLFWVGNTGCSKVAYRAMVNAHCVYEQI